MPKSTVSDPITDQEMAFVHLILSGTMTDRQAAEAVGLNPDTAAYTKSKPRVRAYMIEHRAAVREKLVDQEADGLRKLNLGRDQILNRLWELATLSHEETRGSIAGQIKALAMIVAIEGLIPDRRLTPSATQPAAPPVKADIYEAEWLGKQQHRPACEQPSDPIAVTEPQPAASQPAPARRGVPEPELRPSLAAAAPTSQPDQNLEQNLDRNQPGLPAPILPRGTNWVPQATGSGLDAFRHAASSPTQPFSIKKGPFGRRR
jgi:hypothetical protein